MSTPQAKRRRLNNAASTLTKPFVSPFKTPLKQSTDSLQAEASHPLTNSENVFIPSKPGATPSSRPTNKPLHNLDSLIQKSPSLRKTRPRNVVSTITLDKDPEIMALLKRQRDLERELREAKEALDVVDQARRIEEQSAKKGGPAAEVDGDLMVLVAKWRGATRGAAEELFGGVKDRVNRMGGPAAWREMQKKQRENQSGWDVQEPAPEKPCIEDFESDEDDDEEEKAEKRRMREAIFMYGVDEERFDVEVETVNEREQRGGGIGDDEEEGNEDEFTMSMMLKTLNIDPKLIGYDKEMQRWVD